MPNVAKILKEEITRLARKEVRVALETARRASVRQQREIASLKAQVGVLKRQLVALEKAAPKSAAPPQLTDGRQVRFVPKGLASTRKRLGLSVAELARLMGVTAQTIYNWEHGATRPSPEQRAKLVSLRRVGKREMQTHLATA